MKNCFACACVEKHYESFVENQEWRMVGGINFLDTEWARKLKERLRRLIQRLCRSPRTRISPSELWSKKPSKYHDTPGILIDKTSTTKLRSRNARVFTYAELYIATRGFSQEELLGAGGFGRVYRAVLPSDGSMAAVKCVSEKGDRRFERTLEAELSAVGQLRHKNLVSLKGWCFEENELFLVYDYMPNSSLDRLLFSRKGNAVLDYARRYQIVDGLAAALFYLHEQLETQIVHRDVKTSNVMLDSEFNARLGDFGLARWIEHAEDIISEDGYRKFSNKHFRLADTCHFGGTIGYIPPETLQKGYNVTDKSDVFSFGIVALEVATSRRAIDLSLPDEKIVLVDWIRELHDEDRIYAAVDPKAGEFGDQLKRLLYIGLFCSLNDPGSRPKMKWIIQALRGEVDFPALPAFKALPYYASLSSGSSESLPTSSPITTNPEKSSWGDSSVNSNRSVVSDYAHLVDAPREYSLADIAYATDGFSTAKMVAELDFGTAYRGVLKETNQKILVKRLGNKTCPALRSRFSLELTNLGRVRHRNLMQLRGWCTEQGEVLVVYDGNLMNRPLSKLIRAVLDWPCRVKILKGLAEALSYLHGEWEDCVMHKSVSSGNVFVDADFNPRLGGFALAEFVTRGDGKQHASGAVRGIFGYMSPEYVSSGKATVEGDVFGFGVVVLEVVCGRTAVDFGVAEVMLLQRVWRLQRQGRLEYALDSRIEGSTEAHRLLRLGILCTRFDARTRPTMRQACLILDGDDRLLRVLEAKAEGDGAVYDSVTADAAELVRRMQGLGIC